MRRVLFALVAVAGGSGCLCGGCMCPSSHGYKDWQEYRAAEAADREKKAQPVIDALEAYKAARGAYPARLDELVAGGFLPAVPDLASTLDHQGEAGRVASAEPLRYTPGGVYTLRLVWAFAEPAWATTPQYDREYAPDGRGWQGAGLYGPRGKR